MLLQIGHGAYLVAGQKPLFDSRYRDLVGIVRFDKQFSLAGGVNMPRIIDCEGTDGRKYKQVVKGNDDVRQDAVMQQVCELANAWLKHDRDTQRRRLHVCTHVVPCPTKSTSFADASRCNDLRFTPHLGLSNTQRARSTDA